MRCYFVSVLTLAATVAAGVPATAQEPSRGGRPVTAADVIRTTVVGDPEGIEGDDLTHWAEFAPDRQHVAVVVRHGKLEANVVESSILVFAVGDLINDSHPDTVATFASSSNRAPIAHVRWLGDGRTLVFLAERPGEVRQVYAVDIVTRALTRLTDPTTPIAMYDITSNGDMLAYTAKPALDPSAQNSQRSHGYVMTAGAAADAVLDRQDADWNSPETHLVVRNRRTGTVATIADAGIGRCLDDYGIAIAPTGRFVIRTCGVLHPAESWLAYRDSALHKAILGGNPDNDLQYMLADVERGTMTPVLNAPLRPLTYSSVAWAPDGHAVALGNVYLPLDVPDSVERARRAAAPALAEVDVVSRAITPIVEGDSLHVVRWEAATNTLVAAHGRVAPTGSVILYRKVGGHWSRIERSERIVEAATASTGPITLTLEQGLNAPPLLVATDARHGKKVLLLDPNPQFKALRLGRVEAITWRSRDGRSWSDGIYYPPDYVAGRRYPLVIQTHGFEPTRFSLHGRYPTAFAAQALAAHGILVLQTAEPYEDPNLFLSVRELPTAMAHYESAVDYLDQRGLVDRTRVGLIGFSRTCSYVKYTLTHSAYSFVAASVTDGVDDGYLQYLVAPELQWAFERDMGAAPFGAGLDAWRRESPGFNMDKIHTPLQIVAIGPRSVLTQWETYAGLKRLRRPVEMFVIPDGIHVLAKPWERLASSQGSVDWFRFWLKGEEDPDPAKADQYARWRELRRLQDQQTASDTARTKRGSE